VEWFLGTHFPWLLSHDKVSVHLSQIGFATHLNKENTIHKRNITPDTTPYRSGLQIDAIPESDEDNKDPALLELKQKYRSIIGSIGWFAHSTRPNLVASHYFLAAYSDKPLHSHCNTLLYVLHYIHSTINYGRLFTSKETAPLNAFMHFPTSSDMEAYHDAIPHKEGRHHHLSTYSDACWGLQLGIAMHEGIQLPPFKFVV
jgi:hypothetical protein